MQTVYLSRRNLEVLLSKLDRKADGEETACAIIKQQNPLDKPYLMTMKQLKVVAVPDELFYANRAAGEMHPKDVK